MLGRNGTYVVIRNVIRNLHSKVALWRHNLHASASLPADGNCWRPSWSAAARVEPHGRGMILVGRDLLVCGKAGSAGE